MSKYYHVMVANKGTEYNTNKTPIELETGKQLNSYLDVVSFDSYTPAASALLVQNDSKNAYIKVPIFCEHTNENDTFVTGCITGRTYSLVDCYKSELSESLIVYTSKEIEISYVANLIKSLSNTEINNYNYALLNLEKAIAYGYQIDIKNRRKKDKNNFEDETFIKSLRNRFK